MILNKYLGSSGRNHVGPLDPNKSALIYQSTCGQRPIALKLVCSALCSDALIARLAFSDRQTSSVLVVKEGITLGSNVMH